MIHAKNGCGVIFDFYNQQALEIDTVTGLPKAPLPLTESGKRPASSFVTVFKLEGVFSLSNVNQKGTAVKGSTASAAGGVYPGLLGVLLIINFQTELKTSVGGDTLKVSRIRQN